MKNKSSDLNNYLFEIMERLMDNESDFEKEAKIASAVCEVATNIINNGKLQVSMAKILAKNGSMIKDTFFEVVPNEKPTKQIESNGLSNFS